MMRLRIFIILLVFATQLKAQQLIDEYSFPVFSELMLSHPENFKNYSAHKKIKIKSGKRKQYSTLVCKGDTGKALRDSFLTFVNKIRSFKSKNIRDTAGRYLLVFTENYSVTDRPWNISGIYELQKPDSLVIYGGNTIPSKTFLFPFKSFILYGDQYLVIIENSRYIGENSWSTKKVSYLVAVKDF